jgi:hypothetical protein
LSRHDLESTKNVLQVPKVTASLRKDACRSDVRVDVAQPGGAIGPDVGVGMVSSGMLGQGLDEQLPRRLNGDLVAAQGKLPTHVLDGDGPGGGY